MKKILLALSISALLGACGNEKADEDNKPIEKEVEVADEQNKLNPDKIQDDKENEVSEFVKKFNELATAKGDTEEISSTSEIDESGAQVLYSSNNYGIIATHDEDGLLSSYSVVFFKNEPYEEFKGIAFDAMLNTASALNVDSEELKKEFKNALDLEKHLYLNEDYAVMFFNHKLSGQSDFGIVVEFVKRE